MQSTGGFLAPTQRSYPRTKAAIRRDHEGRSMNANLRNFALWVIIVLLLLALFTLFQTLVSVRRRRTSRSRSF